MCELGQRADPQQLLGLVAQERAEGVVHRQQPVHLVALHADHGEAHR